MLISGTAGDTHHTKTQRLHGGGSTVEPPPWSLLLSRRPRPSEASGCGRGALSPDYLPSVTGGGRLGVEFLPAGRGAARLSPRGTPRPEAAEDGEEPPEAKTNARCFCFLLKTKIKQRAAWTRRSAD